MDARAQIVKAYEDYLGRGINEGEDAVINDRVRRATQDQTIYGSRNVGDQINDIRTSAEAQGSGTARRLLNRFDENAKNPLDIYNTALEKLGISDARTRVTNLRQSLIDNQNLLDALPGNISSRTSNSLVTEAQRQRLQAAEQAPIANTGEQLNRQFSAAQEDYGNILGEGKTSAELETQDQSSRRAALMDRLRIAIETEGNEEKKREWQAEYDRQLAQDKQNQSNLDRAYAREVLESDRNFQKASAKSSGGSKKTTSSGSSKSSKSSVEDLFEGYDPNNKAHNWYTEDVVIPKLISEKGYTLDKARQVAYDYRKAAFNE